MSTELLDGNFDANTYLKTTLQRGSYDGEQNRLKEATSSINKRLHKEIADNFPKLKEQVHAVQELDRKVEIIHASAHQLQQSVQRTESLLEDPYEQVQNKVRELQNIWGTADLLRKLGRFLALASKAREHQAAQAKAESEGRSSAASLDLPKEAKTLRDIELAILDQNGCLNGIAVVDTEKEWLKKSTESVHQRAHDLLKHGLNASNQAEIRTAVQAFYNLEAMGKVISKVIADHGQELRKVIAKELDPQGILGAITSSTSETPDQKTKTVLFQRLETTFQAMLTHVTKLSQLVKVMEKTKDPATQVPFIAMMQQDGCNFVDDIWRPIATIEERLPRLVKRFTVVVTEYPKVHHLFEAFVQNVSEHFPSQAAPVQTSAYGGYSNGGPPKEASSEPRRWKELCLGEAQTKYLKDSQDRLREKCTMMIHHIRNLQPKDAASGNASVVNNASSRSAQPALLSAVLGAQVDTRPFVSVATHELAVTQGETNLQQLVFRMIAGVLRDFTKMCRKEIDKVNTRSAVLVNNVASNNQLLISVTVTCLLRLHGEIQQLHNRIGFTQEEAGKGQGQLLHELKHVEDVVKSVFSELTNAVQSYLEEPVTDLLTVKRDTPPSGRSPHSSSLHTLEQRWQHLEANIMVLYGQVQGEISFKTALKAVMKNLITLFVNLLSLVRPLNDAAKVSLTADVMQFQLIIGGILNSEKIGKSFKELRAFRTQLSLDTHQLHTALCSVPRTDSLALELSILSPLTLLHCITQRIADAPSLFDLVSRDPVPYAKEISFSPEFASQVEAAAWDAYQEWANKNADPEQPDRKLLWECLQAWHARTSRVDGPK
ncbi:Conserved oligomeric Golgi complex subunit 5 [Diplonema papillatum]|nr:Conserved oligomeric Golgi complex subunit 5 [Diplonema papillatum]